MSPSSRTRSSRLEIRTTSEDRELISRAAAASGTDLTTFVTTHSTNAAREILADRDRFNLSAEAADEWDWINATPAAELAGLRELMARPSPFTE